MIFALATPVAQSALAVFRVSGAGCGDVLNQVLDKPILEHRKVFLREIVQAGRVLDKCSLVYYSAPNSYTGEDSVEVFCHGSLSVIGSLTSLVLKRLSLANFPGLLLKMESFH